MKQGCFNAAGRPAKVGHFLWTCLQNPIALLFVLKRWCKVTQNPIWLPCMRSFQHGNPKDGGPK